MVASASQMAPTVPMTSKIVSMLASPKVPRPPTDSHWFYLALVLLVLAALALLAAVVLGTGTL
jgi:hypothetical protein